jgi:cysteine desulfurase/selenocysteine lyase
MIKEVENRAFNVSDIREEFPALSQDVYEKKLIYFDNGATSQKPQCVIDAINKYYSKDNSNIHRGVHYLSQMATNQYEASRKTIQNYINAPLVEEVVFTKGTTDGINLLAHSLGEGLSEGDEVLISEMEHHSNIVPWQMLCERKKCLLKIIPINEKGELDMLAAEQLINSKTKIISITHISNSLGTINPVKTLIQLAKKVGAYSIIDGAQSIQHMPIDVQDLGCDFFVFSGHKVFGPTGIGILYGKKEILDAIPPYQGGGDMIDKVTFEKTTYNELPFKFEAGTPNIAGAICLGTAFEYLNGLNLKAIQEYESKLLSHAESELLKIEDLRIIGTANKKASVVSFIIDGIHPFDIGTLLDKLGIAVRTGHHCTQPLMEKFKIPGTIRASFAFYNTIEEVDYFIEALKRCIKMLK